MIPDDVGGVMEIEKESFVPPEVVCSWIEELGKENTYNYVAKHNEGGNPAIVGYINFVNVAGEIQLNHVAVRKNNRREGIGRMLMRRMMEVAVSLGINALTLEVRSSNQTAIQLYEKSGFVIEGCRKNYYSSTGEDALIMWAYPNHP
ncbi:MAG: hypothetical protein CSYNP_03813 [Syntrophus sp. SKADARSKE-3]|nr:hypothetical protein [Syntrophus sp. SKADARSKE-3]